MTPSFIEEYQLEDLTICDSLIKMYEDASAKGLAYRGKSGIGRVQEEVKKAWISGYRMQINLHHQHR